MEERTEKETYVTLGTLRISKQLFGARSNQYLLSSQLIINSLFPRSAFLSLSSSFPLYIHPYATIYSDRLAHISDPAVAVTFGNCWCRCTTFFAASPLFLPLSLFRAKRERRDEKECNRGQKEKITNKDG